MIVPLLPAADCANTAVPDTRRQDDKHHCTAWGQAEIGRAAVCSCAHAEALAAADCAKGSFDDQRSISNANSSNSQAHSRAQSPDSFGASRYPFFTHCRLTYPTDICYGYYCCFLIFLSRQPAHYCSYPVVLLHVLTFATEQETMRCLSGHIRKLVQNAVDEEAMLRETYTMCLHELALHLGDLPPKKELMLKRALPPKLIKALLKFEPFHGLLAEIPFMSLDEIESKAGLLSEVERKALLSQLPPRLARQIGDDCTHGSCVDHHCVPLKELVEAVKTGQLQIDTLLPRVQAAVRSMLGKTDNWIVQVPSLHLDEIEHRLSVCSMSCLDHIHSLCRATVFTSV